MPTESRSGRHSGSPGQALPERVPGEAGGSGRSGGGRVGSVHPVPGGSRCVPGPEPVRVRC